MKSQTLPTPAHAREPLHRTAKSSGPVSRSTFEPAAPASRRNVGHRSHTWPVFRVHSSFPNVIRRKRRQKHAVQYCPRHNLFTGASMLIFALLNVPLRALREQQQQQASTFALNWHFLLVVERTRRQKTRSRALSAAHSHRMGLYAHICHSKCATGSPATAAAAAAREHFCTELTLFCGLWGAQDAKNTQQGTVCGTVSSHGPLCSYLHF